MLDDPASSSLLSLKRTAARIANEVLRANAARVDQAAEWPSEGLRALADAKLTGLHVPTHLGGLGGGLLALAVVSEELGAACGSTAMCFGMHCVATKVLAVKATSFHEERYLRPIAEGRHLTSLALSEPETGAHFYIPRTRLKAQGDGFELDGLKSFVTSGSHAGSYVISAVPPGGELDPGNFTCLVMDGDAQGVEWQGTWQGLGMRGNSSRAMKLNHVYVPKTNLLGSHGDEIWYVFEVVTPYFLTSMSGVYLGIARAALEAAIEHLTHRRHQHATAPLSYSPVLSDQVAEMWTRIERTRLLIHHSAKLGDSQSPGASTTLFAAKIEVAETVVAVTNAAMMLCGGRGYGENALLARLLRDAQAAHIMSPTTHLLKNWLGRAVLGLPML